MGPSGLGMQVTCSAPGKTILMGEHAAVYGRPALVAAVNQRLSVELREIKGGGVQLSLPAVGVHETVSWDVIREYAQEARRLWREYAVRPDAKAFDRVLGKDPSHLVKVALGEAAERVGEPGFGLALQIRSEIPIGAGFGSSAAAAVAITRGYLELLGVELSDAELESASLEVERRQHGLPSGVDSTSVIRGGLLWAVREPSGDLAATTIDVRTPYLGHIKVFNSGTPSQSTGAVVAAVRERRDADPVRFKALLDRMEAATREFRRLLESSTREDLGGPLREFESCLEEIGVVPLRLQGLVRAVEARGGAAKISGAGALSGTAAGSLLVYHPEPQQPDAWECLRELKKLDVGLGAQGVRVEDGLG